MTENLTEIKKFNNLQALTWYTQDKYWFLKIIGLYAILVALGLIIAATVKIPILGAIIFLIISTIILIAGSGYIPNIAHKRVLNTDINLFEIKKELFVVGIKIATAASIYGISFIPLIFGLFLFFIGALASNGQIPVPQEIDQATLLGISGLGFIITIAGTFFAIPFTILYKIGYLNFLVDLKFGSFFSFRKTKKLLKNNVKFFLKLLGFNILYCLIFALIYGVIVATLGYVTENKIILKLLNSLVNFIVFVPLYLVIADLDAQFIKKSLKKDNVENE